MRLAYIVINRFCFPFFTPTSKRYSTEIEENSRKSYMNCNHRSLHAPIFCLVLCQFNGEGKSHFIYSLYPGAILISWHVCILREFVTIINICKKKFFFLWFLIEFSQCKHSYVDGRIFILLFIYGWIAATIFRFYLFIFGLCLD